MRKWFRIEGKVGRKKRIQFIEKRFEAQKDQDPKEAAEEYAEKYCKNWKQLKIKEISK